MKFFLDFLPIILFFVVFKVAEGHEDAAAAFATQHLGFAVSGGVVAASEAPVMLATVVVIIATLVQIAVTLLMRRRVDAMLWVTFALVGVLGGATVWFHNPTFIKWKPSGVYWAMAIALWVSQTLLDRNVLQALVGDQLQLPRPIWRRLNYAWVMFFALMGVLNLYVAYAYSTSAWATFKVFGLTGIMLVFMVAQGFYVSRHIIDDEPVRPEPLPGEAVPAGQKENV